MKQATSWWECRCGSEFFGHTPISGSRCRLCRVPLARSLMCRLGVGSLSGRLSRWTGGRW